MIFYLGFVYILIGISFLAIPLVYIEVGRPKDFIKAGLNLLIGITLIIKNKVFENSYSAVYLLITILFIFYLVEICSIRWNQLTQKEQDKLITLGEFKKNLSKILNATVLLLNNFLSLQNIPKFGGKNENLNKKRWVRTDENDKIKL